MDKTCQSCVHGLIRVERTRDWNYEGCALGYFMSPRADRPACQDYEPQTPEQEAARAPYLNRSTIVWGPPLEYPV